MKEKLLKVWKTILSINNEFITMILAVAILAFMAPIVRLIAPNSIPWTGQAVESALVTIFVFLLMFGVVSVLIKIIFPGIFEFKDKEFTGEFKKMTGWQKVLMVLCLYYLLLALLLLVFIKMMIA